MKDLFAIAIEVALIWKMYNCLSVLLTQDMRKLYPFLYMKHVQPEFIDEVFRFHQVRMDKHPYERCAADMAKLIHFIHPVATMTKTTDQGLQWATGNLDPKRAAYDVIRWVANELKCPEIPVLFDGVLNFLYSHVRNDYLTIILI